MAVAHRDFTIKGTVEFVVDIVGGPTDLSGYVGSMMIRELRADAAPLATVAPEYITVDAGNRQVTVRIPSSVTETYNWARGLYDLVITGPSADKWSLVEGRVINSQLITRS